MGGILSGRRTQSPKSVTSSALQIDINILNRKGALSEGKSGFVEITTSLRSCHFHFKVSESEITFTYEASHENEQLQRYEYEVPITWTQCNYGGSRPWFCCPKCDRRCGILYIGKISLHFLCRNCQRLCYQSQLENELGIIVQRINYYKKRLGLTGWASAGGLLMRPKYMRLLTFIKLGYALCREEEKLFSLCCIKMGWTDL